VVSFTTLPFYTPAPSPVPTDWGPELVENRKIEITFKSKVSVLGCDAVYFRAAFLNRRTVTRYRVLASIKPGRERFSWNLSF